MIEAGQPVAVELIGGPLDGTVDRVVAKEQPFNLHLFAYEAGARRFRLGYTLTERVIRRSKDPVYALEFECVVAAWTMTTGTGNTGEEADGR